MNPTLAVAAALTSCLLGAGSMTASAPGHGRAPGYVPAATDSAGDATRRLAAVRAPAGLSHELRGDLGATPARTSGAPIIGAGRTTMHRRHMRVAGSGAAHAAVRPVPGLRLRGFDPPAQPWLAGHRGVDLAADVGDAVVSARAGVVLFAGPVGGTPVVTIDHGQGLHSTYQPVQATVTVGQPVLGGDEIGRLTAGAHCTRSCLHLGARRGDAYLEPFAALGLLPVLLPLLPTTQGPG
ncbi:MAG: M23 family metallopeptidase [Actinomycetales bacterium]|nr:M23 family metallopeptidase [Actinomycetales bacterium]